MRCFTLFAALLIAVVSLSAAQPGIPWTADRQFAKRAILLTRNTCDDEVLTAACGHFITITDFEAPGAQKQFCKEARLSFDCAVKLAVDCATAEEIQEGKDSLNELCPSD